MEGGNEEALQEVVGTKGPVSVSINAYLKSFRFYKNGVYTDWWCFSWIRNHAVIVVGYGESNGTDFWLVKNSWGSQWGLKGYVMMARYKSNQCGIASDAILPIV